MRNDWRGQQSWRSGNDSVPFASNAVRLSPREWGITALIVLPLIVFTPTLWTLIEPFEPSSDYRIPYAASEDYWMYSRLVRKTVNQQRILVIGDSVVWGEYVTPQQTLTHYLNEQEGWSRFANGGLDAAHPISLAGLVRDYAADLIATHVILHCNLLWMSSPERDLQTEKEVPFNHPWLVPQLTTRIPCYKTPVSQRLGIVVDRSVPFRGWVNHLRITYWDHLDLHHWSFEHPYANPFNQISLQLPRPSDELRHRPIPWTERGIEPQDMPWIELDTSLGWRAFQQTVELLRRRGNRVFVLVGPFNEHLLSGPSRQRYRRLKGTVEDWLRSNEVPYYAPAPLPSNEYADASHPLSAGYARLAERIYEEKTFQRWLGGRSRASLN